MTITDDGVGMDEIVAAQAFVPFFSARGADGLDRARAVRQPRARREPSRDDRAPQHRRCRDDRRDQPSDRTADRTAPRRRPEPRRLHDQAAAVAGPVGPRVLCVDDEPLMLRLVSRLLERMGLVATTAPGPAAALKLFDAEQFDLVMTDIRMPGMDGHAFLAAIRARDQQVPVIVATGSRVPRQRDPRPARWRIRDAHQAVHRRGVHRRGHERPRARADPPRRAPVPVGHADPRRCRPRAHGRDRGPGPRDRRPLPRARHARRPGGDGARPVGAGADDRSGSAATCTTSARSRSPTGSS